MTDLSFEEYWASVTVEFERVYGIAGDDISIPGERIAGYYRTGETPSRAALDIGAELRLLPSCQDKSFG